MDVEDGIVKKVQFVGGCNGNTKGIAALVEGMPVDEVVKRLEGIPVRKPSYLMSGSAVKGTEKWQRNSNPFPLIAKSGTRFEKSLASLYF